MVWTLHLSPDTFKSPNVISLLTVAEEADADVPIQVFPAPVVILFPAWYPSATLLFPVLWLKAVLPIAVDLIAVVVEDNALTPTAVLSSPVVLSSKEALPTAVLLSPVVY